MTLRAPPLRTRRVLHCLVEIIYNGYKQKDLDIVLFTDWNVRS